MNKLKTMRFRQTALWSLLIIAVVAGMGLAVKAFSGNNNGTVIENAEVVNVEASEPKEIPELGALSSPDIYGDLRVHGRFAQGGYMLATSTAGSATTLLSSDLETYSGYDFTPGDLAVTMTTQASSTIRNINNPGDCFDFRFRNLDATAATSTTIAAGTGIDMVENENGDVVIEGGNEARMTFCRELDTDITLYVDEYIAAD